MIITALVTPFSENQEIDFNSLENLLKLQVRSNVEGILILGTTAESPTIEDGEKDELINFITSNLSEMNYSGKIWLGVSDNSTFRTIQNIKKYNSNPKIDGFLISSPWYNKPLQEGLKRHFLECDKSSTKEIMLYNVPGRTGVNILPKTIQEIISNSKNIKYVKEASGNLDQIIQVLNLFQNSRIKVLSGDDSLTFPLLNIGISGVVSVVSNIYPDELREVLESNSSKKYFEFLPKMNQCFELTNPIMIKDMLFEEGVIRTNQVRLPLVRREEN